MASGLKQIKIINIIMTTSLLTVNVADTIDRALLPLLNRLNIVSAPIPGSILTSVDRASALLDLKGLIHPDTTRFIYRVLICQFSSYAQEREGNRWDGVYLSIPTTYIRKAFHRDTCLEIPCLVDLGILRDNGHARTGRCKGYRVVWNRLTDIFKLPVTMATPKTFLALSEGKRHREMSEVARTVRNAIPNGMMNLVKVINYFDSKIINNNHNDLTNLLNELNYVFTCYSNRTNWDSKSGILTYKQNYHTTEIGGRVYSTSGDQLVSRELKERWFDMPNTYNYDIKGCHISLVNQIYPTIFASNWIDNTDGFRNRLSMEVGIPLELMKRSVLALTYGAHPIAHPKCAIFQLFIAHFRGNKLLAEQSLGKFKIATGEYREALMAWFNSIKNDPKRYQTNAIGLTTDVTDYQTLASHWLQGKEQEAVHWLSRSHNQNRYRYRVISNQFDGLVTLGEIPPSIMADFQAKFKLVIELKGIG